MHFSVLSLVLLSAVAYGHNSNQHDHDCTWKDATAVELCASFRWSLMHAGGPLNRCADAGEDFLKESYRICLSLYCKDRAKLCREMKKRAAHCEGSIADKALTHGVHNMISGWLAKAGCPIAR